MNDRDYVRFLDKDEEVVLSAPGLFKDHLRSGWRPGRFSLTNRRIFFYQTWSIRFETQLNRVVGVGLEKKPVVVRTKHVVALLYRKLRVKQPWQSGNSDDITKVWLAVPDVESWRKKVYERALLRLDEDTLQRVMNELDPDSEAIVSYLWENKHANIDELSSLYGAPNHMHVLFKIREVINPISERVLGYSILNFDRSRRDPESGKTIPFSWWIANRAEREAGRENAYLDIFDEGGCLNIIMELPGVKDDDIVLELGTKKITISASSIEKKYHEEIDLPAEIDVSEVSKSFNNNVLTMKLRKRIKPVESSVRN